MIYHIIAQSEWKIAQRNNAYTPPSLAAEGFIHFSTKEQILRVANFLYKGQENLRLLAIDESLLSAEIVYEDLYDHGDKFPHLYAHLSPHAVVAVYNFPAGDEGIFTLPSELNQS